MFVPSWRLDFTLTRGSHSFTHWTLEIIPSHSKIVRELRIDTIWKYLRICFFPTVNVNKLISFGLYFPPRSAIEISSSMSRRRVIRVNPWCIHLKYILVLTRSVNNLNWRKFANNLHRVMFARISIDSFLWDAPIMEMNGKSQFFVWSLCKQFLSRILGYVLIWKFDSIQNRLDILCWNKNTLKFKIVEIVQYT